MNKKFNLSTVIGLETPIIATIISSVVSLGISFYTVKRNSKFLASTHFHTLYIDCLKIGIENPNFRNIHKTRQYKICFSGDELIQYESYAHLIWTICEGVYYTNKQDAVIIAYEERELHLEWLREPEHQRRFKRGFVDFILPERGKASSGAPCSV